MRDWLIAVVLGLVVLGCMAAGVMMTDLLVESGMPVRDAFNNGLLFTLVPVVAVGIIVVIACVISLL